jgi:hypothetical protein
MLDLYRLGSVKFSSNAAHRFDCSHDSEHCEAMMRLRFPRLYITAIVALLSFSPGPAVRAADILLDFTDIPIPGDTDSAPFFVYSSQGFTLLAVDPGTGFLSGFQAHGANSIFFMGKIGVVPFAPTVPPDNVITLTSDDGEPFSMLSIDLARNFPFDPAPTVTFTGLKMDGNTVTESFTVDTPAGVREFETFQLTGFTNLVSVSWGQPPLADGLHQFTDILLQTGVVPEPNSMALLGAGGFFAAIYAARSRRHLRHD